MRFFSVFLLKLFLLVPSKASAEMFDSWDEIVKDTIVANGNIYPPNDQLNKRNSCMLVLSHNAVHRYCPRDDGPDGKGALDRNRDMVLLRYEEEIKFRGAFYVEGYPNRVWFLVSPSDGIKDFLEEFDLRTGKILQILRIPGTVDAHDVVRVGKSVFVVDTRHGYLLELELPKPAKDEAGIPPVPRRFKNLKINAIVKKRHKGFIRIDHPNNFAIHKDVIITSLHGGHFLKPEIQKMFPPSRSRISLLDRHEDDPEEFLKYDKNDFVIDIIGQSNHGLAFYKDQTTQEVRLLSLDSQNGSLISVVISPDNKVERSREVLWKPDLTADYFTPEISGVLFAKGLAVQGNVAYFTISGREGLRVSTFFTHCVLVAYDLVEKKELWSRSLENPVPDIGVGGRMGVANQLVTMEYLNYDCMKLPDGDEKKVCFQWPDREEW